MIDGPVLVSGGSRGIGRAIVERLLAEQFSVPFTYRQSEAAAREIEQRSAGRARGYRLDLGDSERCAAIVEQIEAEHGPLHGLVNNAGIRRDRLLALASDDDWQAVIEANLSGTFRLSRAVLRTMLPRRRGSIVQIASLTALHGVPGQSAYGASKSALIGLTRSLAREVGKRNIRVNVVVPGFVATDMTADLGPEAAQALRASEALARGVSPGDVADAVQFLLSSASASITGQTLIVDAGASA